MTATQCIGVGCGAQGLCGMVAIVITMQVKQAYKTVRSKFGRD